jgi:hypothetical protein
MTGAATDEAGLERRRWRLWEAARNRNELTGMLPGFRVQARSSPEVGRLDLQLPTFGRAAHVFVDQAERHAGVGGVVAMNGARSGQDLRDRANFLPVQQAVTTVAINVVFTIRATWEAAGHPSFRSYKRFLP